MSDYKTMLEVNGNVNTARQINRLPAPWFKAVIESPIAPDEAKNDCCKSYCCRMEVQGPSEEKGNPSDAFLSDE